MAAAPLLAERHTPDPIIVVNDNKISRITRFLRADECRKLIELAESKGFNRSAPSGGGHGRTGREDSRNNSFVVVTDAALAERLFNRVRAFIPKDLAWLASSPYFSAQGGSEWTACGVVDRLRFYKYEKGEAYPEHFDGSYKRDVTLENGDQFRQHSFLTLLLYLNDDFEGGETRFFPDRQHCRFLRDREVKEPTDIITPVAGQALLNIHPILHEGSEVSRGVKYVLRTDVLYQRAIVRNPKIKETGKSEAKVGDWEKLFEPSCKMYHD
eukprot:Mycagemm_TRINITY_DN10321_c5_g2::TRINITY_DN10321_c5_g2_i1::g.759::m.759 type:complete len:269 gc:universal TRINITY_DN10321_c5_g2_i1:29-835(+)